MHDIKFAGGEQVQVDEETGVMLAAHIQRQMMDEADNKNKSFDHLDQKDNF